MKTAIITGASRGIGLATAEKFITEGWRAIGTYLNTPVPIDSRISFPSNSTRVRQAVFAKP